MRGFVSLLALMLAPACCPKAPVVAPEPAVVEASSPYGDLLAHEVMRDPNAQADEERREQGVRAFEDKRFEEARDIFAELLERDAEDEALVHLHRMAEAMVGSAEPALDARWQVGIPECEAYLKGYVRCVRSAFPSAVQDEVIAVMEETARGWREAANGPKRETLAESCIQASKAALEVTEAFGCEW